MKLPNGDQAQLGDKLERYSLNQQHSKGKDKAVLFEKRSGITLENQALLEVVLLAVAANNEAEIYKIDDYGTQYDIKFFMTTETGSSWVLSCWIIRTNENFPRLTHTYPINKSGE
ncbi:DUF6883 domain-containing protein [Pantanalinema rosaneae CENA516]|uniref:DUF6883 domain-containing protein n=1 Tax=Pantanalinema rosaneae TaxID=1620701 RepID=UPI003D6ED115